ncbi:prolipoprotein diacylglyceryl transferase [Cohnella phaseoli]|uniref:Phosphatidylglycerol--prolipoprotein diacylglyceryl transferase n=1 Tax=Cohnella phaseoli TaxID=456490 RepID=A0A3D9JMH5_9BACL|nr:prolipoprotein diacylglyceryl transferase [Cohnella phaseoli]RED75220.1 phosphatidylglycerol:prolipoprotein diacylglycerol transferase [Cohnella phaseoli]
MKVVLFSIGDFHVHSYGTIVALAVLLAWGVAHYLSAGTPYREHLDRLAVYLIVGALVFARAWHVFFFQWAYYSKHLHEIAYIWQGGIAIQGALIGGMAAMFVYTRKYRISFWGMADVLAPAAVLGQAIGRIACFLNGDAYGSPTGSGFGIVYPEGTMAYAEYGAQPLWPAEVWEGQWDMIVFVLLLLLKSRRMPAGALFLAYNMLYSTGRFMLEMLRGDSPRYLFSWTAGQWTSFGVFAASLILLGVLALRNRRVGEGLAQDKSVRAG